MKAKACVASVNKKQNKSSSPLNLWSQLLQVAGAGTRQAHFCITTFIVGLTHYLWLNVIKFTENYGN